MTILIAFLVCLAGLGVWLVWDIERELLAHLRQQDAELQRRMDEEYREVCGRG